MNTKIFTKNELSEAAALIRNGGLVAMPTETVYGLAANALNEEAVKKIYKAKGRESDNPLIVHIANIKDWKSLVADIPRSAQLLAQNFWPGPLTIILKKSKLVPSVVSGGLDTVAVRMPQNKIAFRFIRECGCPLAAPSANISGRPSPTKFSHVYNDLNGRIDGIIDGGDCEVGVESTVISLTGDIPMVLRPGRVTVEQLREVLGEVKVHHAVMDNLRPNEKAVSPGMKYKHYSPKAEVTIVKSSTKAYINFIKRHADKNTAVICFDEQATALSTFKTFKIGALNDSITQAQELFDVLRAIDKAGLTKAYSPMPPVQGVGLAVVNRLLRAAGFKIIDLSQQKQNTSVNHQPKPRAVTNVRTEHKKINTTPATNNALKPEEQKKEEDISAAVKALFAQNIKDLLKEKKAQPKVVPKETKKTDNVKSGFKDFHQIKTPQSNTVKRVPNDPDSFVEIDYEKYAKALKAENEIANKPKKANVQRTADVKKTSFKEPNVSDETTTEMVADFSDVIKEKAEIADEPAPIAEIPADDNKNDCEPSSVPPVIETDISQVEIDAINAQLASENVEHTEVVAEYDREKPQENDEESPNLELQKNESFSDETEDKELENNVSAKDEKKSQSVWIEKKFIPRSSDSIGYENKEITTSSEPKTNSQALNNGEEIQSEKLVESEQTVENKTSQKASLSEIQMQKIEKIEVDDALNALNNITFESEFYDELNDYLVPEEKNESQREPFKVDDDDHIEISSLKHSALPGNEDLPQEVYKETENVEEFFSSAKFDENSIDENDGEEKKKNDYSEEERSDISSKEDVIFEPNSSKIDELEAQSEVQENTSDNNILQIAINEDSDAPELTLEENNDSDVTVQNNCEEKNMEDKAKNAEIISPESIDNAEINNIPDELELEDTGSENEVDEEIQEADDVEQNILFSESNIATQQDKDYLKKIEGVKIIGVTGKSGAGKSIITKKLAGKEKNCAIINADKLYHTLLKRENMAVGVVFELGNEVLTDKKIDRKKLAKIVFSDENNIAKLNKATHPYIAREIHRLIEDAKEKGTKTVVLDAPTLIESELYKICDEVIFIKADKEVRLERIISRDGIDKEAAEDRMRYEKDDDFYTQYCTQIITNN